MGGLTGGGCRAVGCQVCSMASIFSTLDQQENLFGQGWCLVLFLIHEIEKALSCDVTDKVTNGATFAWLLILLLDNSILSAYFNNCFIADNCE